MINLFNLKKVRIERKKECFYLNSLVKEESLPQIK